MKLKEEAQNRDSLAFWSCQWWLTRCYVSRRFLQDARISATHVHSHTCPPKLVYRNKHGLQTHSVLCHETPSVHNNNVYGRSSDHGQWTWAPYGCSYCLWKAAINCGKCGGVWCILVLILALLSFYFCFFCLSRWVNNSWWSLRCEGRGSVSSVYLCVRTNCLQWVRSRNFASAPLTPMFLNCLKVPNISAASRLIVAR